MRIWIGTLCVFTLLQLAAAAPQEQTTKASIEGVITRADNGEPIVGAQLLINRAAVGAPAGGFIISSGGVASGVVGGINSVLIAAPPAVTTPVGPPTQTPTQIAPVTTDANGRFQVKDLEPGNYRVIATATGFVRQEYGQRSIVAGLGNGTPIELTAGQSFKNAAIRMTATGTVSGRIFDDTGQPAIGVPVFVLQYAYDQSGLKTLRQTAAGNADDRGAFRVYGITPGRYYVATGNGPGPLQGPRGASGQPANVSYSFSYYPGVNDVRQASLVEIQPGGEAVADMKVVRQKLYNVRGRVVDATGQMVPNAGLQPGQAPLSVSMTYSRFGGSGSFSNGRSYDPSTGKFEILNVIPGAYVIQAQMQNAGPPGPVTTAAELQDRQAAQASRAIAELPIVVEAADLENLVLTFTTPVSAPGKLTVEGQQLSDVPGNDRFRLQIRKMVSGSLNNVGTPPQQQAFSADGTFQVAGMRVGEYQVSLVGFPPTFYVKSLQFDGKDILGKTLEFSGTSGTGFNIVLSAKPGQVSGTVTDAKMQPVPGVQAVLVPDGKRDRADLYKNSITDQNGRFTIGGITPGNYKVFAWDGIEPYKYFDPEFMKTYEAKGKSIVVGESATVVASIPVTPLNPE